MTTSKNRVILKLAKMQHFDTLPEVFNWIDTLPPMEVSLHSFGVKIENTPHDVIYIDHEYGFSIQPVSPIPPRRLRLVKKGSRMPLTVVLAVLDPKCPYLVKADGVVEQIMPENGRVFKLPELYRLISATTIEVLLPRRQGNTILIVDEDAKSKDSPANNDATNIWGFEEVYHDKIRGDVVICPWDMFR